VLSPSSVTGFGNPALGSRDGAAMAPPKTLEEALEQIELLK